MSHTETEVRAKQLEYIVQALDYSAQLKRRVADESANEILQMAEIIVDAFRKGNKLMICGNGGSASDSQHLATELTIRYRSSVNRPAMPAIALTTDSSALTAGANDIGYDNVFARLTEAYGKPGDILLGISTSGNSESVIRAINYAREHNITTLAFLGGNGGKMKNMADVSITVPHFGAADRTQECHIAVGHIIIQLVEEMMGYKES